MEIPLSFQLMIGLTLSSGGQVTVSRREYVVSRRSSLSSIAKVKEKTFVDLSLLRVLRTETDSASRAVLLPNVDNGPYGRNVFRLRSFRA